MAGGHALSDVRRPPNNLGHFEVYRTRGGMDLTHIIYLLPAMHAQDDFTPHESQSENKHPDQFRAAERLLRRSVLIRRAGVTLPRLGFQHFKGPRYGGRCTGTRRSPLRRGNNLRFCAIKFLGRDFAPLTHQP